MVMCMNGIQVSHLVQNGRNIALVVTGVQANEHQTKALDDWKRTPAVGDHELKNGHRFTGMASTIPGRIDATYFQSVDVAIPPLKLTSNKSGGNDNFSINSLKTRLSKYADARKLR